MDAAPAITAVETVTANLRLILRGLLAVLGAWKLEPARAMVLYGRINALPGRVERMLIRFRAGRQRRSAGPTTRGPRMQAACRGPALPRRFGWLVRLGGWQAAGFGSQLQTVLNTPDIDALLAASPQAVRLLRPLCRALAVDLPAFRPAVTPVRARAIRKPRVRVKPEPFRIPLPRGVISAARRAGFGKLC